MRKDELQLELEKLNISTDGKRTELVQRLLEAVEAAFISLDNHYFNWGC